MRFGAAQSIEKTIWRGLCKGSARVALMGSKRGYLGVFFARKLLKNIYPLRFRF